MAVALQTDSDGYLANKRDWNEDVAVARAHELGVELSRAHWKVLYAARAIEEESGASPGLRKISRRAKTPIKSIYRLFPDGPAKLIAKIAGIPKPKSCL